MAVSLSDVRFIIQDLPRSFGVTPETPRVLGVADGTTTVFYLPVDTLQYVAGTAALFLAGTGVDPSTYTISQQGVVTFASAPAAGSSTQPNVVSASFQATVFADADLTTVLNLAIDTYNTAGDAAVRAAVQLDMIDLLLTNPEKMAALKQAEWERNPQAVISAYKDLRTSLQLKMQGGVRPGQTIPVLTMTGPIIRPYQPGR